jgi:voltage-gated potassium channel
MFKQVKKFVYSYLERTAEHPLRYSLVNGAVVILIVLNVGAIIMESFDDLHLRYKHGFRLFEIYSVIVFTFEYLCRMWVSDRTLGLGSLKSRINYFFSPMAIVDLAAILPFYLPMFFVLDLRFLRVLRLMRLFRIFKLTRYVSAVEVIASVLRRKKTDLLVTMIAAMFIMLISSTVIYYAEHDAQPDSFPNIIASFWWAVATLTTVGYGDVYPVTVAGKVISGVIAFVGIGLVALPTGIISSAFVDEMHRRTDQLENPVRERCPHCGKIIKRSGTKG